jgi:hypothetical protein
MEKEDMQEMLDRQVASLADFVNGYKACAKFMMDNWGKKGTDGTGIQTNQGTAESA